MYILPAQCVCVCVSECLWRKMKGVHTLRELYIAQYTDAHWLSFMPWYEIVVDLWSGEGSLWNSLNNRYLYHTFAGW